MDLETAKVALNPRQRMIWMENQLAPRLPVNCEVCYLSIYGALDAEVLQNACQQLFQRHDALRATLVETHEAFPRLAFPPTVMAEVTVETIAPGALRAHLAELSRTPFGFDEPLSRIVILSEGADTHHIVFVQSHLVIDGWAVVMLFKDVERLYEAALTRSPLPTPGSSFRNHLQEQAKQRPEAEAFWEDLLQARPPAVKLYGQGAEPFRGRIHRTVRPIPDELRNAVRTRQAGVSPAQAFSIATAVAVYRTTGESSIGLGVPVLNRTKDMLDVVGLFMEVLPNRFDLEASQNLSDLGKLLTEFTQRTKPYRGHAISTNRSAHDISLNFYPPRPASFMGHAAKATFTTALETFDAETVETPGDRQFGLTIRVFDSGEGPEEIAFDFDVGRWPDAALHARFADCLMKTLAALIDDPQAAIGALDILSGEERARARALPEGWHPFPSDLPAVTEMIRKVATHAPDRRAVIYEDQSLTYRELVDRAEYIAGVLVERGAGPGSLVAVCMGRSVDLPVALLAVLFSGAAYVPLDPVHPVTRLSMIMEDADPALLLVDDSFAVEKIAKAERTLRLSEIAPSASRSMPPLPAHGALAYVIFTSGSTGRPKGVRVPHHGLSSFLMAMREVPGFHRDDRLLAVTTVAFDIAALELFLPLISGAEVHIAPYEATLDGAWLARIMQANGMSVLQATPATYRLLLGAGWQGKGVRALCGGEALPDGLARSLVDTCDAVWNMYGPTETTIWSSVEHVTADSLPVTIGRPISGTRFSVRTPLGALCPPGTPGELNIAGDGVTFGYHNHAELTAEKFVADTDGSDGARRYRTGDAVRQLPDGRTEFIGRIDFQVKVRGFRIELGEIEAHISQVPGVDSAAVIPFSDPSGETALAAYYSGNGSPAIKKAVQTHLAENLPIYMRPAFLQHLDRMPLSPSGKTDRKALPEPDLTSKAANETGEPATFANDLERCVAGVWESVLGQSAIGPEADFFDLGGHSILAMNLVLELEKATGVELDLGAVFAAPTVAAMAAYIRKGAAQMPSAVISLQQEGSRTPLFCLCGLEIYRALAQALGKERPVFGLYVEEEAEFLRAAASGSVADVSISKLADAYSAAILRNHIEGPLQLLGVSFGGVLALETARALEEQGLEVSNVIMLDTIRRDGRRFNPLKYTAAKALKVFKGNITGMTVNLAKRLKRGFGDSNARYVTTSAHSTTSPERLREIAFIKAMEAHESCLSVNAPVLLVKASDRSIWGDGVVFDEDYGWGSALGKPVEVLEVEGDHLGILRAPVVHTLASALIPKLT